MLQIYHLNPDDARIKHFLLPADNYKMRGTVLVIDDDLMFRQVICHAVKIDGFEAIAAEDGRHALELAKKVNPNLILLDLMMPGVNGLQVLGVLKADSSTSNIPIIVLSATMTDDVTKQAHALGADAMLYKTQFSMGELRQLVKRFLSGKSASAA